jgi:predicted GNAT family N-acyltransferase
MTFEIIPYKSREYYQALSLRDEVLRKPLNLFFSEEDILQDASYVHFAILNADLIIATAQLVLLTSQNAKMRQVAVHPGFQRKGIGKKLVDEMELWCTQNNINNIELHARETAMDFYLSLNYTCQGEQFLEVGIPHFKMIKDISS